MTIHYREEQDFLSDLLFKTHKIIENVWIGAKYTSNKIKWNDNSDSNFTNWAEGSPKNETGYDCIQMLPEGSSMGKWVNEPCRKNNLVVCQRMQIWSFSQMQKIVLNILSNPVPIGFIYVQLPSQPEPKTLWPMAEWKNISQQYAGHFFRVEGDKAASFGQPQSDSFQEHTHEYENGYELGGGNHYYNYGDYYHVYSVGQRTKTCTSSVASGYGTPRTSDETRPKNYAIRVWKRTA